MKTLVALCPPDDVLLLAGVILLQVTVVLLIAWLTSLTLRRSSAAVRHGLWLSALVCVLACTLLTLAAHRTGLSLWTVSRHAVPDEPPSVEPVANASTPAPATPTPTPKVARTTDVTEVEAPVPAEHAPRPAPSSPVTPAPVRPAPSPSPVVPAVSQTETLSRTDVLRAGCVVAGFVWLVGVALLALRLIHGLAVAVLLRRAARPLSLEANQGCLEEVRAALGGAKMPPVLISSRVDTPLSAGVFRPVVILPEGLPDALGRDELRDVLVHECAHVLRGDHRVGLLERIARMVFWPHPLVHRMSRELSRAREEVCDNLVLADGDPQRYARALVELAENAHPSRRVRAAMGLIHRRWTMAERVRGILNERRSLMTRMNRPTFAALVVTLLAVVVVVGAVRLEAAGEPEAKPQPKKTVSRSKPVMRVQLPADRPENRKVQEVLDKKTVSFTFNDQPVKDALAFLQTLGGLNIVLDLTKLEDPDQTITLKLTDVPLGTALRLLVEQLSLKYVVRDGVVFISDEEGVKQPPVTAVYDVRDLLKLRDGIALTAKDQSTQTALAELIKIIQNTIEPGTWDMGSGYAISGQTISGLLVITHVPDVHQRVQELLDMLREARTAGGMVTNTYDVSDILAPAGKKSTTDFTNDARAADSMRDLVNLVRSAVDAGTWDAVDGANIRGRQGALIVTHRSETMAKVERLLETLREKRKATAESKPELFTVTYAVPGTFEQIRETLKLLDEPRGSQKVMLGTDTVTVTADVETHEKIGKRLEPNASAPGTSPKPYDVEDLLRPAGPAGPTLTAHHPSVKKAQQRLVDEIMKTVAPGTWDPRAGHSLHVRNFTLVVRHTPEVQKEVDVFLTEQKRTRRERLMREEARRRRAELDRKER